MKDRVHIWTVACKTLKTKRPQGHLLSTPKFSWTAQENDALADSLFSRGRRPADSCPAVTWWYLISCITPWLRPVWWPKFHCWSSFLGSWEIHLGVYTSSQPSFCEMHGELFFNLMVTVLVRVFVAPVSLGIQKLLQCFTALTALQKSPFWW